MRGRRESRRAGYQVDDDGISLGKGKKGQDEQVIRAGTWHRGRPLGCAHGGSERQDRRLELHRPQTALPVTTGRHNSTRAPRMRVRMKTRNRARTELKDPM